MPMRRSASLLNFALAAGLALFSGCDKANGPTAPTPPPAPGAPVHYTALGASDAIGIGASVQCVPLTDCPGGTGYVPLIVRELASTGSNVTLTNLGLPGAVLGPDVQALARMYNRPVPGNILENTAPFVPIVSTLVTIFAGGNDVNTVADAIRQGEAGANVQAFIDNHISIFARDFAALVQRARQRAPNARIVVANLPNFAALPYTAHFTPEQRGIMRQISVGFSTRGVNPVADQGIPVVDLLCDGRSYVAGNYSSDGFHPNDAGYAFMASEMLRAITSASHPRPASSCAPMTY
jgi:lysophospholipase L1-like esterase